MAGKEISQGKSSALYRHSASIFGWISELSIAQSYRWFGVSEFATRLPLALYVLAIVLIFFYLARRFFVSNAAGLYAGLVILLWPGTYWDEHLFSPSWLWPLAAPIVALGIGYLLAREETHPGIFGRRLSLVLLILGFLISIALAVLAFRAHTRAVPERFELPLLRIPLLVAAAAVLIGAIANYVFRLRNRARLANCYLAGSAGGLLVAFHVGLVILSPSLSSQILTEAIRPELGENDVVLINGTTDQASSFLYYIDRPTGILSASGMSGATGEATIAQLWGGPTRVFLWTETSQQPALPGKSFVIAQCGGKEILSNQPNSGGAEF